MTVILEGRHCQSDFTKEENEAQGLKVQGHSIENFCISAEMRESAGCLSNQTLPSASLLEVPAPFASQPPWQRRNQALRAQNSVCVDGGLCQACVLGEDTLNGLVVASSWKFS